MVFRKVSVQVWLAVVLCLLASLGCSLKFSEDDPSEETVSQTGNTGGGNSGTPPTVQIISPSSGQQVRLGEDVEIRVVATDAVGVDRLQLNVSGRTSSSKAFPEQSPTSEALLRWRPDREGTFDLTVFAVRGSVSSEAASLTLQVVGRTDAVTNPVSGQAAAVTAGAGECVGRVLIGNLRIRTGPSTSFDFQGNFELNEQVTVVGQNAAGSWIQVRRLDSSVNWVINNPEWIETTGTCTNLPVTG